MKRDKIEILSATCVALRFAFRKPPFLLKYVARKSLQASLPSLYYNIEMDKNKIFVPRRRTASVFLSENAFLLKYGVKMLLQASIFTCIIKLYSIDFSDSAMSIRSIFFLIKSSTINANTNVSTTERI